MALDAYAPCPCGSGEKYKFCCPKELHAEFERVLGMLRAEQRAAALDACDRVLAKHPAQACFLTLKAQFLVQLGELAQLQTTARQLLQAAPTHQAGHAATCLIAASEGDVTRAIGHLQDALDLCKNCIGDILSWGMEAVIFCCFSSGKVLPTLAYALAHVRQRDEDQANERVVDIIRELQHDANVPLVFKEDWHNRLVSQPSLAGIANLSELFEMARFRAIRDAAADVRRQSPDDPHACLLLAVAEACLANDGEALELFRELAGMPSANHALAIDGVLLAQYISDEELEIGEPLMRHECPIRDMEKLMEQLLSHRQTKSVPGDLRRFVEEDEPPPKAAFMLFDRPIPSNPAECPPLELPISLGTIVVYGKQTDRGARLEVLAVEDAVGACAKFFAEFPTTVIGERGDGEVLRRLGPLNEGLVPRRYMDQTQGPVPTAVRDAILDDSMTRRWFELPHPFLEGKSPTEAAGVPELRRPLMAALLALETMPPGSVWRGDFSALWSRLGLQRELAEITETNLFASGQLSLSSLVRLDPARLTDDQLVQASYWAVMCGAGRAAGIFVPLVLKKQEAFEAKTLLILASRALPLIVEAGARVEFLQQIVDFCRNTQVMSPGLWEVSQFEALLAMGDLDAAGEKLRTVMATYRNDESVMRALGQTMMALGLIGPDGRLRSLESAGPAEEAPAQTGGRLWTPDQAASEAPAPNAPSKLWIPGT